MFCFKYINSIIIKKGDTLPASNTNKYILTVDGGYNASVTQSDDSTENKDYVHIIKQETVNVEGAKKDDEIEVTYSYDKNQMMHCSFEHVKSGKKFELELKSLSSDTVDQAREQMKNFDIE